MKYKVTCFPSPKQQAKQQPSYTIYHASTDLLNVKFLNWTCFDIDIYL